MAIREVAVAPEDDSGESFEVLCDGQHGGDYYTEAEAVTAAKQTAQANGLDKITVYIEPQR